ncbi:MAG: hypothetical protein ACM3SQ_01720 [Betaproteobacteria bacterium]
MKQSGSRTASRSSTTVGLSQKGRRQLLKAQTSTDTFSGAFLALTGTTIREESANRIGAMPNMARMWRGGR